MNVEEKSKNIEVRIGLSIVCRPTQQSSMMVYPLKTNSNRAGRDHPASNPFGSRGMESSSPRGQESFYERERPNVKLIYLPLAAVVFYLSQDNIQFHRVMQEIRTFVRHLNWISYETGNWLMPKDFERPGKL
ncbi:uncharacterized protein LOC113284182 isoform X2 [Papaver somniferum]|uniref:uncharacterized protein LOC113284182 isoform X2 n=1 Tax=Papaver somniferum TaxID=3469 RepID=UPI000E6F9019|nr:uncharacterized protein LOC113284182 isoform X2 [Papaver somniferum]